MKIEKTWTELKNLISLKKGKLQYNQTDTEYYIWFVDNANEYYCIIDIDDVAGTDQTDFENNYKANANQPVNIKDSEGRSIVRSESRPINCTITFTGAGDVLTEGSEDIGTGTELFWDSNDGFTTTNAPQGYKQKSIEIEMLDNIWIKDGKFFCINGKKHSYVDFYIICPDGQYYTDNDGNIKQASGDTIISHYVNKQFFAGDTPYGILLNTESCTDKIPTGDYGYKLKMIVTIPDDDTTSYGWATMELYRTRNVIL